MVFPHDADTQAEAEADPNAEAPPVSVNEDTVAHQVVNGDTVAHQVVNGDTVAHHGVNGDTVAHHGVIGDTVAHQIVNGDTVAHQVVNGDTVAHQVVNGDTVAHQGAEGDEVGVETCGDLAPQSCTTAQQVCSFLDSSVSVAQSYHGMHLSQFAVVTWSESGVVMHMHVYLFDFCRSVIQSYFAALNACLSYEM